MGNYPVGPLIAEFRKRRAVSQEELSDGICAVSTLSKIENGVQMPSRKVYTALLQRLGMSHRSCLVYVSSVDMQRSALEDKIEQLIGQKRYEAAYEALEEYITCGQKEQRHAPKTAEMPQRERILTDLAKERQRGKSCGCSLSTLELQYVLYQFGVLEAKGGKRVNTALELLESALGLTVRDFSLEHLKRIRLFTWEEVHILCQVAVLRYGMGAQVYAKSVLFVLRDFMEMQWMDPQERAKSYPEILYHLSVWMGNDKRVETQLEFCNRGIDLCLRTGKLDLLPQLLSVKGCALAENGREEQAGPVLKQAYLIFQLLGESVETEALRKKAKALFQIDLRAGGECTA